MNRNPLLRYLMIGILAVAISGCIIVPIQPSQKKADAADITAVEQAQAFAGNSLQY